MAINFEHAPILCRFCLSLNHKVVECLEIKKPGVTKERLQPTQMMEQPNKTPEKERIVENDGFQSVRGKKSRNREQRNDYKYVATYSQWPQDFEDCVEFMEE